jgi:hypothetical protein
LLSFQLEMYVSLLFLVGHTHQIADKLNRVLVLTEYSRKIFLNILKTLAIYCYLHVGKGVLAFDVEKDV